MWRCAFARQSVEWIIRYSPCICILSHPLQTWYIHFDWGTVELESYTNLVTWMGMWQDIAFLVINQFRCHWFIELDMSKTLWHRKSFHIYRPLSARYRWISLTKGKKKDLWCWWLMSEWVIKFNGFSRDSEVHIVHIIRGITAYTLESLSSLTHITHNLQVTIKKSKKEQQKSEGTQ